MLPKMAIATTVRSQIVYAEKTVHSANKTMHFIERVFVGLLTSEQVVIGYFSPF